jgi:fluoroquinolone transport system permease protein
MKNRLLLLIQGELSRLHKYNFTSISIFVAFIWGVVLFFVDIDMLSSLLPMVLMLDATMMAVMYVGAVMYFEKNESTISTLLVTPISNAELILSKVISYTLHNMLSAILLIGVFVVFKDVEINYLLIFSGVIITTAFFTVAGIVLSFFQKDFTGMLVQIMVLSFALFIPSLLLMFGVIEGEIWETVMMFNPIQAAQELIGGGFKIYEFTFNYYFSLGYLLIGGVLLYRFYALPKFQDYAVKQSGV